MASMETISKLRIGELPAPGRAGGCHCRHAGAATAAACSRDPTRRPATSPLPSRQPTNQPPTNAELYEELQCLPEALRSEFPDLAVDFLATVFGPRAGAASTSPAKASQQSQALPQQRWARGFAAAGRGLLLHVRGLALPA